jgi:hypothetical protein
MAAQIEGDFVVFLIGARINKPWLVHKWLPVANGMRRMLAELDAAPKEQTGLLGYETYGSLIVQYWRSFEHLERYARAQDLEHFPAWVEFNKKNAHSRGDVGIWHETYLVRAGEYEAVYSGMPPIGLGKAGALIPARGRHDTARGRAGKGGGTEPGPAA